MCSFSSSRDVPKKKEIIVGEGELLEERKVQSGRVHQGGAGGEVFR